MFDLNRVLEYFETRESNELFVHPLAIFYDKDQAMWKIMHPIFFE